MGTVGRGRWSGTSLHRFGQGGVPYRAARRPQGPEVLPPARAGEAHPQVWGQASGARHPHRPGPHRAGRPQAGARADLRGGLQAGELRLPPEAPGQDAIAEVHFFCSRSYEWVLEGDITSCFDEIDHQALMDRVRGRIGDKRVLALVKAFLKAGVLSEDGAERDQVTGTPQGGILSPLLANIALSVLDEHFV